METPRNCRICFDTNGNLIPLEDEDNKYITKLKAIVPELVRTPQWLETFSICIDCSVELDIAFNFRQKCLQTFDKISTATETMKCSKVEQLCIQTFDKISTATELNVATETMECSKVEQLCLQTFDKIPTATELNVATETMDCSKVEQLVSDNIVPSSPLKDIETDEDDDIVETETTYIIKTKKEINETNESEHKNVRMRTNFYFCQNCEFTFNSAGKLIKHSEDIHDMTRKDIKPYLCPKCDKRFKTSTNLKQHLKYHQGTRSEICAFCGKGFITKPDLFVHEKIHFNEKTYSCEFCQKSFNTHKNLGTHKLIVHTDPSLWNYVCNFCNKRFPQKSNMTAHVRRHKGEKLFECHLCQKKFCENGTLKKHIFTHSNVRNYKCTECGKMYRERRVMEIHMAKIHGIGDVAIPIRTKKYICHICPKAYFDKNKLTRHLYTHTGEKPFRCEICEKCFIDKSYLTNHIKNTHLSKTEPDNI